MWATPLRTFLRSFFFLAIFPFALAIVPPAPLISYADRSWTAAALAGTGVGMGTLPANREPSAVTQPPVTAEIHESFDVHGDLGAEITLYLVLAVDGRRMRVISSSVSWSDLVLGSTPALARIFWELDRRCRRCK